MIKLYDESLCMSVLGGKVNYPHRSLSDEDQKKSNSNFRKVTERLFVCLCLRVRTKRSFATNQYCFLRWTKWEITIWPWLWLTWFIQALNFHIQQFNKELKCKLWIHTVQDRQVQTATVLWCHKTCKKTHSINILYARTHLHLCSA